MPLCCGITHTLNNIEQMLFWSGMLTLLINFECKSLIKSQLQKTYRKQIFRKAEKLPNILSAL